MLASISRVPDKSAQNIGNAGKTSPKACSKYAFSLDAQAAGRAIDDDVSVKTGEPEGASSDDPFGGVSREFDPFSQVSPLPPAPPPFSPLYHRLCAVVD